MKLIAAPCLAACLAAAAAAQRSVVDTAHNLSATGPGALRAVSEQEVCVFCHTPHGAAPVQPLWNRLAAAAPYTVYTSSALDARPDQPTGASKLCLSCHDGTIALGSVLSRDQVIHMAGGITTLPPGGANLGTDLSDDHPISFRYDAALALRDRRLIHPQALHPRLRLDANQELQCTTCHDAHDDTFGAFLVMDNRDSALCNACHRIEDTAVPAHQECSACHRPHSAPSGPFLLVQERVTDTCLWCHDGSRPGALNIRADMEKLSVHDTRTPAWLAGTGSSGSTGGTGGTGHATCTDCHDPHTMDRGSGGALGLPANFGRVAGVNLSGAAVDAATFEYEVCFRCHGDGGAATRSWVPRQITQTNTRLEFAPSAISFHPVAAPGRNPDVPSLMPGLTTASQMSCSDCHGSDTGRKAGGSGPDGVHGSNEPPLLVARYSTTDFTPESSSAYALCYTCHRREGADGILGDRSFPHRVHVVDSRAPCSVCHDAHGVSSAQGSRRGNSHLINFDSTIVFPDPASGMLRFQDTGVFSGSCTLACHGVVHANLSYGR
jgi:predicted CXXCH cytochrome family protein